MNINDFNLISTNSFSNMAYRNIHVLLVEHESRDHDSIMNLLHYFSCKVTTVNLVSKALTILSKGKVQFDLVMVNMNSPDSSLVFQLLHDASKMKLIVIFMTDVDDDLTTMRALERGAYLCMRKPLSMEILGSLWQFVLSEKERRPKETQPFTNLMDHYHNSQDKEFEKYVLESNKNYNINLGENQIFAERSASSDDLVNDRSRFFKRKAWTEWTLDLHLKFMAAARYLGQGKCYPKDILELMNVPGLTRMQVASHLQKCRNANWLPPNERKSRAVNGERTPRKITKPPRAKTPRFGLMPFWEEEYSQFHQTIQEYHDNAINHQDQFTINPPTQITVFGHDHAESSNTRLLNHGLHPFEPDNNIMGNLDEQFLYGDYQTADSLTNFLPNIITEEERFEPLPLMDSEIVHGFQDLQQELERDFDDDWEKFILDLEEHDQVSAAGDANNQQFHDAFNSAMANEETEEGQMKEG